MIVPKAEDHNDIYSSNDESVIIPVYPDDASTPTLISSKSTIGASNSNASSIEHITNTSVNMSSANEKALSTQSIAPLSVDVVFGFDTTGMAPPSPPLTASSSSLSCLSPFSSSLTSYTREYGDVHCSIAVHFTSHL